MLQEDLLLQLEASTTSKRGFGMWQGKNIYLSLTFAFFSCVYWVFRGYSDAWHRFQGSVVWPVKFWDIELTEFSVVFLCHTISTEKLWKCNLPAECSYITKKDLLSLKSLDAYIVFIIHRTKLAKCLPTPYDDSDTLWKMWGNSPLICFLPQLGFYHK